MLRREKVHSWLLPAHSHAGLLDRAKQGLWVGRPQGASFGGLRPDSEWRIGAPPSLHPKQIFQDFKV